MNADGSGQRQVSAELSPSGLRGGAGRQLAIVIATDAAWSFARRRLGPPRPDREGSSTSIRPSRPTASGSPSPARTPTPVPAWAVGVGDLRRRRADRPPRGDHASPSPSPGASDDWPAGAAYGPDGAALAFVDLAGIVGILELTERPTARRVRRRRRSDLAPRRVRRAGDRHGRVGRRPSPPFARPSRRCRSARATRSVGSRVGTSVDERRFGAGSEAAASPLTARSRTSTRRRAVDDRQPNGAPAGAALLERRSFGRVRARRAGDARPRFADDGEAASSSSTSAWSAHAAGADGAHPRWLP